MWSRIISWILAAITSLMNGFGMYTQEYKPFVSAGEYTVQEEAVDYTALKNWYISSYGGSGVCNPERKAGQVGAPNAMGFVWLVEGGQHNPDAKLEFESGTVLLAPSKGKITNSPTTSGNKIVVQCDDKGFSAYKLEIINPEKWYCCVDAEPSSTGLYVHKNVDHRIDVAQGDILCIAGPETTLRMWRGNQEGVLAECKDLRTFMLYTSDEGGDPSLSISAGGNLRPSDNNQGGTAATPSTVPGVEDADIFNKTGRWLQGASGSGWWYCSGDPKNYSAEDYPHNQYLYHDGNWYYFDSNGWMLDGWTAGDGHYYLLSNQSVEGHPHGSMAINTIVPMQGYETSDDRFVYVGMDGLVDTNGADTYTVNNQSYTKQNDYYVKSSTN